MLETMLEKTSREKIADALLDRKDLLRPSDSTQLVSDKMVTLGTNMLPVSEDGLLLALADKPNPGRDASAYGHDPKTTRISETMNRDVVFCFEDDPCADALKKMEERDLSHLPVVNREMRILGLVAREDLNARIAQATTDGTDIGPVVMSESTQLAQREREPKFLGPI
jgi:predicted transcriptional regulator